MSQLCEQKLQLKETKKDTNDSDDDDIIVIEESCKNSTKNEENNKNERINIEISKIYFVNEIIK